MTADIGANGFVGIAFESGLGVYTAPTVFFPIRSEGLKYTFDSFIRRNIRKLADANGAIPQYAHIEGDIEFELMETILPYFLYASRNTIGKTGSSPNFVYTTTPTSVGSSGLLAHTLSITVIRNGAVFGYVGCVVGSLKIGLDGAVPIVTATILGTNEASQSLPTPSFSASDVQFSAGMYTIEVPNASAITDVDTFDFNIDDNPDAVNRLGSSLFASYIKFGERSVQATLNRDFQSRTDYDAWKAGTATSLTIKMTRNASRFVYLKLPNAYRETYEVNGLSGQGDLIMANAQFDGIYDPATSKAYEIVVGTSADLT